MQINSFSTIYTQTAKQENVLAKVSTQTRGNFLLSPRKTGEGIAKNTCGKLLDHIHVGIVLKGGVQLNDVFVVELRVYPDLALYLFPDQQEASVIDRIRQTSCALSGSAAAV